MTLSSPFHPLGSGLKRFAWQLLILISSANTLWFLNHMDYFGGHQEVPNYCSCHFLQKNGSRAQSRDVHFVVCGTTRRQIDLSFTCWIIFFGINTATTIGLGGGYHVRITYCLREIGSPFLHDLQAGSPLGPELLKVNRMTLIHAWTFLKKCYSLHTWMPSVVEPQTPAVAGDVTVVPR